LSESHTVEVEIFMTIFTRRFWTVLIILKPWNDVYSVYDYTGVNEPPEICLVYSANIKTFSRGGLKIIMSILKFKKEEKNG
jgi:hypothetical protein